jgi:outer membrane protein TolC
MKTLLAFAFLGAVAHAQLSSPVERPHLMIPLRSYMAPTVAPIHVTNSNRLYDLIRAGNLYLSVQDAIALAVENNLNLEIYRYGPLLAESAYERSKGGGPLRGVPSGSAQVSSVDAGLGVNGVIASAGLGGGGGGGGVGGGGNNVIQQIGAITPNLDPTLTSAMNFSHLTQPQANTTLSQTEALIQSVRTYNTQVQQGLLTGGTIQFRDYEQHLFENAPSDSLEPAVGPRMDVIISQNFLQSFGVKLNDRGIRIAAINVSAARETFRSQVLDLVTSVLNVYWDVATASDELKIRQHALDLTERFVEDTKYEISIGAIAGFEQARAEADLAKRRQEVTIAQATLRQREAQLKEALSHREDPALEAARIVPLDHIEVPETDEMPSARELLKTAMTKRPDVAVSNYKDQTDEINLAGTTNPLLPTLRGTFQTYDRGLSGTPQASGGPTSPYFHGGYGNALGQIFRRNFPSTIESLSFSIPFGNRQAQGDYGIDQLQYRQGQLQSQRDNNRILVDISSQVAALRQARARYETARDGRLLQEQLLAAEQRKSYGTATFNYIMADQRNLIAAQISELNALASYGRARVGLDQVLGETLEKNNISLEEALAGKVNRESRAPEIVKK